MFGKGLYISIDPVVHASDAPMGADIQIEKESTSTKRPLTMEVHIPISVKYMLCWPTLTIEK